MRASMASMDDGLAVAHNARTALDQAAATIEETQRISLDVAEATRSMQHASGEVSANMDGVSSIVEQNAAAAHELEVASTAVDETIRAVAEFASQQSESAAQVASSANEIAVETKRIVDVTGSLRGGAEELLELIDGFKGGEMAGGVAAANVR